MKNLTTGKKRGADTSLQVPVTSLNHIDRLGTLLGGAQGLVVGGCALTVAGIVLSLVPATVIGVVHALAGVFIWWRVFGFARTVPVQMRTWSNDNTRPLAPHELRRVERKLAWEYRHDVVHRYGPCWTDDPAFSLGRVRRLCCATCWRRRLDGTHTRRREALVARRAATPLTDRSALRNHTDTAAEPVRIDLARRDRDQRRQAS